MRKGSKVYIEGSIHTRKYQAQDGTDRYATEIKAMSMQMIDSVSSNNNQQQSNSDQSDSNTSTSSTAKDYQKQVLDKAKNLKPDSPNGPKDSDISF